MAQIVNLYMCVDTVASRDEILSQKARDRVLRGEISWLNKAIEGFDSADLLILGESHSDPKWKGLLDVTFPEVETIPTNRVTGALLHLQTLGKRFVIPFGTGYFSVEESRLVGDFGLMITANEVLENSLRFLDSNNPSAGTKSRVQSDRLAGVAGFDLDTALAFIKKLGGISENEVLGSSLTGSSGIKVKAPIEISLIRPTLEETVKCYNSEAYKARGLEVIASMKPITDTSEIRKLDLNLMEHVRANDGEFVLACPVVVDWDVVGIFKFGGWRDRTEHLDLSIDSYLQALFASGYDSIDNIESFLIDVRSTHCVLVLDSSDGRTIKKWPVYRCFQGSVEYEGKRYAISDGRWFTVSENFRAAVQATFENSRLDVNDAEFPAATVVTRSMPTKGGGTKNVPGIETEGEYNARASAIIGAIFLDKETGSVPGIANQRNELCDVLVNENRLVHIKKGSRTSGQLHHLFRQGATAARMLRDPEFLESIANKLRNGGRDGDADVVLALGSGAPTIEFRVIDKPRANGDFDIPFFAKVALHYAEREIRTAGCRMKLGFIDQA